MAALTHARDIDEVYHSPELERRIDALGLNDRAADIWRPLLAIAVALDELAMADELGALAQEMSPDPDRLEERRQLSILRGLRTLAGTGGTVTGTTQHIADMLQQVTTVDSTDLHGVLSSWEFREKSIRLPGLDTPRRAWEITDAELASIEARLDGYPPEVATTTTTTATLAVGETNDGLSS